ncbi:hypothetical protein SISSUDRAFT_1067615 [Sistotremastrum suecicum HHB10207 ss-3]|uniref:DUF6532 domain-containing protein n=1 Tax=Sistotremastrum suecicum HHB10207 ss-3 TaxID=1314776 RepID=A0A165WXB6_9AGAM|nr:hypothetical protein SISSUDRAFT_1067615 [Sistotremastrum suecicum HHB10207 ss-3]
MKIVRPVVKEAYGFQEAGDDDDADEIKEANQALATKYLEGNYFVFAGRQGDQPKHPYQHPAISKIIKKVWFANRQDDGILFDSYFNPIPITLIAFVVTLIRWAIREWTTGKQAVQKLNQDSLREMFEQQKRNILDLQDTDQRSKLYIAQVQQKLYKAARKAAGFHDEEPLDPKSSVSANVWAGSMDLDNDLPLEK